MWNIRVTRYEVTFKMFSSFWVQIDILKSLYSVSGIWRRDGIDRTLTTVVHWNSSLLFSVYSVQLGAPSSRGLAYPHIEEMVQRLEATLRSFTR